MIERLSYSGGTVTVEYRLAKQVLLCSHGFGVGRDDRGLLSDIVTHLPGGFGYVLFDYYDSDQDSQQLQIKSYHDQQARLQAVYKWLDDRQPGATVHVLGHSLGCIILAESDIPVGGSITLLAPPISLGERFRRSLTDRPDAHKVKGIWRIGRRDGTTTRIPESYFTNVQKIDAEARLRTLSQQRPFLLVLPGQDEVLVDADYSELITDPKIEAVMIDGADHNFTAPDARTELLQLLWSRLSPAKST